jgi:hypothetical protein
VKTPLDLIGYTGLGSRDDPQLFVPALDAAGEPCLQPGESFVLAFDTISAGIRSGKSPMRHPGGVMEPMEGRCYVTTTRAVFVCHRWEHGGDLVSAMHAAGGEFVGPSEPTGATAKRTGTRCATTVLVGQVRWPWLASVSYMMGCSDLASLIEFRCVQGRDASEGSVYLSLIPPARVDVDSVVRTVLDCARDDRLGWPELCPAQAAELRELEIPVAGSRWRTLAVPGAYKRLATTAVYGGHSAVALSPWQGRLIDHIHA